MNDKQLKINLNNRSQRLLLLTFLALFFIGESSAQEDIFIMNQFAPINYNPAAVSFDNDASLSVLHHEFSIDNGNVFVFNYLNAEYPVVNKKTGYRYGGVGINFSDSDLGSSALLKTTTLGLSLASTLRVAKSQELSYGAQLNYYSKRSSFEGLSTGSQWIADEFRYDPNVNLGETSFEERKLNYSALNAGILWNLIKNNRQHTFVGISTYFLNSPKEGFLGDGVRLPAVYMLNAGSYIVRSRSWELAPQVLIRREGVINTFEGILSLKYLFANDNPYDLLKSGDLAFNVKHAFREDLSMSLVINQPGYSIGIGYTFPLASGQTGRRYVGNATELGLTLRKSIWKKKPQRLKILGDGGNDGNRDFQFDTGEKQVVRRRSEVEIMEEKIKELDDVKALQFELVKDFHFEFGDAELNSEAKRFLDEIASLMTRNKEFSLEIIGHTDNVGKQTDNYRLSLERAKTAETYLIEEGISPERIKTSGKGDTDPVEENDSEQGRAKNRRIEFIIDVVK